MKKNLVLFSAMLLTVGLAAFAHGGGGGGRGAHEDGLAVGFEWGYRDSDPRLGGGHHYVRPYIAYGQRFLDDTIGLIAEMDITTAFDDGGTENSLYLNLEFSFDRRLSEDVTLTFILEKEFDDLMLSPRANDSPNMTAVIAPGARLSRVFYNGDTIFTEVSMPITYLDTWGGVTMEASRRNNVFGFNFTFGWESAFGLNVEATLATTVAGRQNADGTWPAHTAGAAAGITNLELGFTYEVNRLFLGLDFDIKRGANGPAGLMITPMVSVNVGHFDIYAYWVFDHVRPGWRPNNRLENSVSLGVRWTVFD
ncbi:MAG: hypothetical protein FWD88_02740 [Treponema sp.]|nr:hypothetical protein [Treponema sp.]